MSSKIKTIVLDLDETLLHSETSNKEQIARENLSEKKLTDVFLISDYITTIRPCLGLFLTHLRKKNYRVIIWTAGCKRYAFEIVKKIILKWITPDYVLHSDHCTESERETGHPKNLKWLQT